MTKILIRAKEAVTSAILLTLGLSVVGLGVFLILASLVWFVALLVALYVLHKCGLDALIERTLDRLCKHKHEQHTYEPS